MRTRARGKGLAVAIAMRTTLLLSLAGIPIWALAACGGGSSSSSETTDGGGTGSGSNTGSGTRPGFTNGVSTLGGWSTSGYLDGDRDVNLFANPVNVALGPDGLVYVADFDNSKVRALDASGNATTIIAQSGFEYPFAMVFGPDGTLYVTTDNDPQGQHTLLTGSLWKIDTAAKTATPIAADIGRPRSLAWLTSGQLAATDDLHDVVELIDPASGALTPLAGTIDVPGSADGTGSAALFLTPYGVQQQADGSLLVCDWGNNLLRQVTLAGVVTTVGGTTAGGFADGALASAKFSNPQGLVKDGNGNFYFTDLGNNRVREISNGMVTTIAGNGTQGYADNNSPLDAEFFGLEGLSVSADGSMVYVADGTRGNTVNYNRVRQVNMH